MKTGKTKDLSYYFSTMQKTVHRKFCCFGHFYKQHWKVLVGIKIVLLAMILTFVFSVRTHDNTVIRHGSSPTYADVQYPEGAGEGDARCGDGICEVSTDTDPFCGDISGEKTFDCIAIDNTTDCEYMIAYGCNPGLLTACRGDGFNCSQVEVNTQEECESFACLWDEAGQGCTNPPDTQGVACSMVDDQELCNRIAGAGDCRRTTEEDEMFACLGTIDLSIYNDAGSCLPVTQRLDDIGFLSFGRQAGLYNEDRNSCPQDCACGDGIQDNTEECDDGNQDDGDGCSSGCEIEEMIPPCTGTRTENSCESMIVEDCNSAILYSSVDEAQCEVDIEGNVCLAGAACTLPPYCGDRIVSGDEQCDDGNQDDGDGCSATCQIETAYCAGAQLYVGPTIVYSGDGTMVVYSGSFASPYHIGYRFVQFRLTGNSPWNLGGVTSFSTGITSLIGGTITGSVVVQNYYSAAHTGLCHFSALTVQYCGDGEINGYEECDDGNQDDGDGCSAICTIEEPTPVCVGEQVMDTCSSITDAIQCNASYSRDDNAKCLYDNGSCGTDYSCTVIENPNCMGSPAKRSCQDISVGLLSDPTTQCSLFYSAADNVQCTYNSSTNRCINDGPVDSCQPVQHGVYITYDTNSYTRVARADVHLPENSSCFIANGGSDWYTFTKNGFFFFEVRCPEVDANKNIQILSNVSWIDNINSVLIPNFENLKSTNIRYLDNGRLFVPQNKFVLPGDNTALYAEKDRKDAIYTKGLAIIDQLPVPEESFVRSPDGNILIKNIGLDMSTNSIIARMTTLISEDQYASIMLPKDYEVTIEQDNNVISYRDLFVAPLEIQKNTYIGNILAGTIGSSKTVDKIYKFGSLDNDGKISTRSIDMDKQGDEPMEKGFTLSIATNEPVGESLNIYYSQDGINWSLWGGVSVISLGTGLANAVVFEVPHLTYYALVYESITTPPPPTTGTHIGGGGGSTTRFQDICPLDRDCSSSYYDNICGVCSDDQKTDIMQHKAASASCNRYTTELNNAYVFAFANSITTIDDCEKSNLTGLLIRSHMAKMISNFAINSLGMKPDVNKSCTFTDIQKESDEMKFYAKLACQLGLMGLDADGKPTMTFNPKSNVTRAQFGTILSRLIRGEKNNGGGGTYYTSHLQALQSAQIMTKIDNPQQNELRGRVMLMLQRVVQQAYPDGTSIGTGQTAGDLIRSFFDK